MRISDVNDSAITLTWRSKTETISGFLIEATPTSSSTGYIPIKRTIEPNSRSYAITGKHKYEYSKNHNIKNARCLANSVVHTGLESGTGYKINIYTLKGNGRSAPFTLTATTGEHLSACYSSVMCFMHYTVLLHIINYCYFTYSSTQWSVKASCYKPAHEYNM